MVVQATSVGRGRGWMASGGAGGALRRPGDVPVESPTTPVAPEMDAFLAAVQAIPISDPPALPTALSSALTLLKEHFNSKEALKVLIERMHERCVEDRLFTQKAAAFYGVAHNLEVEGSKLRGFLLSSIQNEFEANGHLQTANRSRFLNAVFLLCEVFNAVRIGEQPIAVLADPVISFLEQLLSGEEHEIELFATSLAINGAALNAVKKAALQQLLFHVRTVLMSRNISGQSRCWLLLTLDLASKDWAPLSAELQAFYQVHLGTVALAQLQRGPLAERPTSPSSLADAATVPLPMSPSVPESPLRTSVIASDSGVVSRRSSSGSDSQPVARRISKTPGSGRLPQSKWQSNDSGGQSDWKDRKESGARPKGWGHDDRFDKADNYYSQGDKSDKNDRFDRGDKNDRFHIGDKNDRFDRSERNDRYGRGDRNDRFEKSDRNDRFERGSGGGRSSGNWRSSGGDGSNWNRRQQDQSSSSSANKPSFSSFELPKVEIPAPEESWD